MTHLSLGSSSVFSPFGGEFLKTGGVCLGRANPTAWGESYLSGQNYHWTPGKKCWQCGVEHLYCLCSSLDGGTLLAQEEVLST